MAKPPPEYRRPDLPFERKRSRLLVAGEWSVVGLEFGIAVGLFFLGGRALDAYFRATEPWLSVAGALVGVVVGMYLLMRPILKGQKVDAPPPDTAASSKSEDAKRK